MGYNDSWANTKKDIMFFYKDEVLNLFKDFDIIKFNELEKDAKTGLGKLKHWHLFEIIAKKNS